MRTIKVGIGEEGTSYDKLPKASRNKKIIPGDLVLLEFSDGHTCQCVLSPGGDYLCSSCYIQRYATKVGSYCMCPMDSAFGGRLLCRIPGFSYYEFHELSTILEDI